MNVCLMPPLVRNKGLCGSDEKAERVRRLGRLVAKRRLDVLILQEVWDSRWSSWCVRAVRNELAASAGLVHCVSFPARGCCSPVGTGLMVASRFPIVGAAEHVFRATGGLQRGVANGIMHARIDISTAAAGATDLHAFSTHVHAGPADSSLFNWGGAAKAVQEAQCHEIMEFVREMTGAQGTFIVAGDFNSDARGDGRTSASLLDYKRLVQIMGGQSLLRRCGFPSTYPHPNRPTPDAYLVNPAFYGELTCIDHVFSNAPDDAIRRVQAIDPYDGEDVVSDHSLVVVDLEVPGT